MVVLAVLAGVSLASWLGVLVARGWFWQPGPWLATADTTADATADATADGDRPAVAAVIPARNEAALLGQTLVSLLAQDYPGPLRIVLVDDGSTDGTAVVACRIAETAPPGVRLDVVIGSATPPGWAGKVWAMAQGVEAAGPAEWIFFTDADVHHEPHVVRRLVARARSDQRDLVSVMARLRTTTGWEKLLVPAFVYFFALLYPFRWVASSGRTPAAAGGCLLVREAALSRSGGLAAMRGAIIDDVTLAQQIARAGGRLWLGFDDGVRSLRPYDGLSPLWRMVARSAYTELDHSPVRLVGALAGLGLLFAVPPLGVALGLAAPAGVTALTALAAGAVAWVVQSASYAPMVRLHGLRRAWALGFPAAGLLYAAMTASSAIAHARGRGGMWKGRTAPSAGGRSGQASQLRPGDVAANEQPATSTRYDMDT